MRRFIPYVLAAIALCLTALAYSYFIEPHRLVVSETTLQIKGLDPAFEGLRIVAVSDIHAGSHGVDAARMREVVDEINAQDADVVVLLGDYVSQLNDGKPIRERQLRMPVESLTTGLAGIKAKYGVYAVLGNHDGWYNNQAVADALRLAGIRVLENEVAFIERGGRKLRLFGMRDHLHMGTWATFDNDMRRAIASYERTGDIIVLQHSPDVFPVVNAFKTFGDEFKLMIAGHTHGGQVRFPVLGTPIVPSAFGQKYAAGHVREDGKDLFVTTGIGTSLLPFRFLVPPEIAVLTLRNK
ncbi:MAG TPA: metallophosphoesterase [Pyrinomonadaceae bacterium]|nr:metallophosphoesterase [Pyrinomonadaceae bacterium]